MKKLALELKDYDIKERKPRLMKKVQILNNWIDSKLRNENFEFDTDFKIKFQGLIFPMELGDDEDPIVVGNILPERCWVFNTKKRSPVMVCFETVRFSEAKEK